MRIISIHTQHDANLTISVNNEVQLVLELERLFNERYFSSSDDADEFEKQWTRALEYAYRATNISEFDVAITSWVMPSKIHILKKIINAGQWKTVDHHKAHAAVGFYDSPFQSALIVSYDGGGNDGSFNLFYGNRTNTFNPILHIKWKHYNMGTAYRQLATSMPEVTQTPQTEMAGSLALAGKVMGYSAYGTVRPEWKQHLKEYYSRYQFYLQSIYSLGENLGFSLEHHAIKDRQTARDLAATSQDVFQEFVYEKLSPFIKQYPTIDGLVVTGGCGLNVSANQYLCDQFKIPVHVPPAPSDCGISLGGLWYLYPPPTRQVVTYSGMQMDTTGLLEAVHAEHAVHLKSSSASTIAKLLVEGAVIGVARGRQELGPRALGNRSILCYPNKKELKERINSKIKKREWFRPLAPVIPLSCMGQFFEKTQECPYMSFSLKVNSCTAEKFPAIVHEDNTARVQTVDEKQNEWVHEVLMQVGKHTGYPILMNTSFNTKGQPLLNEVGMALAMLKEDDLDYVLIEDYLFSKQKFVNTITELSSCYYTIKYS